MIKSVVHDDHITETNIQGDIITIMSDTMRILDSVYEAIKEKSPLHAAMYEYGIKKAVNEMWLKKEVEEDNSVTIIDMSDLDRNGIS